MALNLSSWKKYGSHIFWAIVLLLLAGFFIRVTVWEKDYYASKEGTERAEGQIVIEEEVDETEITQQQINSYTVAPDRPRYISLPSINITNARVIPVSLRANGELATPASIFDVGWYTSSGKPGQGGTMLMDGHNGGPSKYGVFKYLPGMAIGDIIKITRGDGAVFNYEIVENNTYTIAEANKNMYKMMQSPVDGKESLSLITCTGEWSQVHRTYMSRQFVRAVLTNN
ncbi:class F sortase [Candidatus Saccharibacteria bacterium]|nr:class F sortase [Candidatus Saccharibacteria bacterium]